MGERADDDEDDIGYSAPELLMAAIDIAETRPLTMVEVTHALVALDQMRATESHLAAEVRQLRHAVEVSEEMRRQAVRERDDARMGHRSHPLLRVEAR